MPRFELLLLYHLLTNEVTSRLMTEPGDRAEDIQKFNALADVGCLFQVTVDSSQGCKTRRRLALILVPEGISFRYTVSRKLADTILLPPGIEDRENCSRDL